MTDVHKRRGRPPNKRGKKRTVLKITKSHETSERKAQMKTRKQYVKKK